MRLTLAIIDDRAVVALGLRALLLAEDWVDTVAVIPLHPAAHPRHRRPPTHYIVAQNVINDGAGDHVRRLAKTGADIILSCDARAPTAASLRAASASGYVCLDWPSQQLTDAIREGGRVPAPTPGPVRRLSPRERQLIELLASGDTIPDAAQALGISPHTARDHARNAYRKLEARNRVQAVMRVASVLGDLPSG